jgi:hypothetical protein
MSPWVGSSVYLDGLRRTIMLFGLTINGDHVEVLYWLLCILAGLTSLLVLGMLFDRWRRRA